MEIIFPLLSCLLSVTDYTTVRHFAVIADAIMAMPGRVNMLNISRWAGPGGSYRNIQRIYMTPFEWLKIHWFFIRHHFINKNGDIVIAGDEVVVSKSGKSTHGIGRFFSSLVGKPISSLSFQVLSLISVDDRKSYPICLEQMTKPLKEEEPESGKKSSRAGKKSSKKSKNKKKGRPKGSKNRNPQDVELSPGLVFLKTMIDSLLKMIGSDITVIYFVYDGALGNNKAVQAIKSLGLKLISKIRYDSALYFPYEGPYSGRGRPKKYGEKIDYDNIPDKYLKNSIIEDGIRTDYYQMEMLHKKFTDILNIVIIVKTDINTGKKAHAILFTTDTDLSWEKICDYYSLRFQIEFNFRDAKQFWGLEDFMNIREQAVINAANISILMVNISHEIKKLPDFSGMSILDIKTWFRAGKYVRETLKLLPELPEPVFIKSLINRIAALGRINRVKEPV